jgi:hypothetical protein
MSVQPGGPPPEYILTRTRFQSPMYDGAVEDVLGRVGVCTPDEWRAAAGEGLVVLRSTVMDPFLAEREVGADHIAGFVAALHRAAEGSLTEG